MGVRITDLNDSSRFMNCNWWNWRPLVALIVASGLLSEDDMRIFQDGHGGLEEIESRELAAHLRENVLSALSVGQRIRLDGRITSQPDDGTFHRIDQDENYGVSREMLAEFVEFIENSRGFCVV